MADFLMKTRKRVMTLATLAGGAVLGWLAAISWPRLNSASRAGRVLAVVVALAIAGYQATR